MDGRALRPSALLLGCGLLAFALAGLSIADMFLPRARDGVVLEVDAPGRLMVREVAAGSGADRAGILPGDQIVGIDRDILRSAPDAARILNRKKIGERVLYLVRGPAGLREVKVVMEGRVTGGVAYLYACVLGFAFFFVGLFVLHRQPRLRAAQIFFILCILFLLFLVCRLRPASYSWLDTFILTTGMVALLFLPATFLHFFLIFPRPVPLRPAAGDPGYRRHRARWLALLAAIYLLPPVVLATAMTRSVLRHIELPLISGAPVANWWLLAAYFLCGLAVLGINSRLLQGAHQRRGAALVFVGTLFGLLPFLVTAVAFPSFLHTEEFFAYGLAPLALVPLSFAWAIVRFQFLDIRVIVEKGLLYTATTVLITGLYALGITLFNSLTRGTTLSASPYFPLVFALAIVLLFEPLRRRLQAFADRFIFAQRRRLQMTLREMGRALAARVDLRGVVEDLVERLPAVLGLHFAALYLLRDEEIRKIAGRGDLPRRLRVEPSLLELLATRGRLTTIERIRTLDDSQPVAALCSRLAAAGVDSVGLLASPRRRIGLIMLSPTAGGLSLHATELELLERLLSQAAMAMETSFLLEERTRQAELERELEIAASVQARLLPAQVSFGPGWRVATFCRPARHVGGDFFTELPGPAAGSRALVYGDVAGKSVAGALVMMAAHEALHSLAMISRDPAELFSLANRRLYGLGQPKSFVAVAYFTRARAGEGIDYILAGQPQPLLRQHDGEILELPLPDHRLPLGALVNGRYRLQHAPMAPGDLLLGYSDGVIEAVSPAGEAFGSDRLAAVVRAAGPGPDDLIRHVVEALRDFTQGSEPYDDITLVALARAPEDTP